MGLISFFALELRMELALSVAQASLNFLLLCDPASLLHKEKATIEVQNVFNERDQFS